jgi:hypothetical protein
MILLHDFPNSGGAFIHFQGEQYVMIVLESSLIMLVL